MPKTVEKITSLEQLRSLAATYKAALDKPTYRVLVCGGTGCVANGSLKVYEAIKAAIEEKGLLVDVDMLLEDACTAGSTLVEASGCHGFCERGPLVRIEPEGVLYTKVKVEDVPEVIESLEATGKVKPVERLLYHDPVTGEASVLQDEIPFYAAQTRVALNHCGHLDPDDLRQYIAHGGYEAVAKVLTQMTPEEVIETMKASGLKGRGGGGFLTGLKWQFARESVSDKKYVICNGDEGDPGAFMDRSVLEGDPHTVIEGMMINAFAIGADEGYIYVRAEYPLAVGRLRNAIRQAEEAGLLGENIFGTGFNFKLHIKEGAGAFVCGEETALIASIEGERGMPRPRPPFPAKKGLWGKPTNINNVETLANVPYIINRGAEWFASMGTKNSAGTKTFALVGQVENTGLIEVPMGLPLKDIIFKLGGGVRGGKRFKAVQIGGPSGGCLTEEHLDLPMDYDSLKSVGAMIGSGGMVVMDETTCMVEVARFFMSFAQNESCGKCVPCREGTLRMLEILTKITEGEATAFDLEVLEELALTVADASLCGLGKTAPNPVLTTLKYFRHEYEAHVFDKRCPAGQCTALKALVINADLCIGCTLCARACPVGAISGELRKPHTIDQSKCIKCEACIAKCRHKAIAYA